MSLAFTSAVLGPPAMLSNALREVPLRRAHRLADGLDEVTANPVLPIVFLVVIAVIAFVALALVIGALAAYIYYCQLHGGRWPGLGVPGPNGGYYTLRCIR